MRKAATLLAYFASISLLATAPAPAQTAYEENLLRLAQHLASIEGGCIHDDSDSVCVIAGVRMSTLEATLSFTHYSLKSDKTHVGYACDATVRFVIGHLAEAPSTKIDCGSPQATTHVQKELAMRPHFLPAAIMSRMSHFFRFIPMSRSQFT